MSLRWTVGLVAVLVAVAACSDGTSSSSSSTAGVHSRMSSTIAATTTTSISSKTSSVPASTVPGALFLDQVALPVMLFVDGVVHDLSEVPAPELVDLGQLSLPYAGPPVVTEEGLLVATGASYEAALTLYRTDGGDPVELAQGIGSFALSPDGQRLAWAEPTFADSGIEARLVEIAFPSGQVLHTTIFNGFPFPDVETPVGFADVVTYVGDNVLLMTGDGAVATAAVWTPETGRVAVASGYNTHVSGNVSGNRVVLGQGDGTCGVVASIGDDGSVTPPDGGYVTDTIDCWASVASTFSPDGAVIASAGTEGESGPPILLLTSVEGDELARLAISEATGQYFQPHTIRWLDNETLLLLASSFDLSRTNYWDEDWGIWRCDTRQSECDLAQTIAFDPTGFNQVALVDAIGPTASSPAGRFGNCDSVGSISGDFDGDGTGDAAVFDFETGALVVCTGNRTYTIPGSGQGESLVATDLNKDGTDEILFGGTTAWGSGVDMAVIVDGVLDYVRAVGGDRLTLWEGLPPDRFLAYGCADFTGEGQREVAAIEGDLLPGGEASWERSIYRIMGHDAIRITTDYGTFDPSGSPDPLSTPELASLRGDRCWSNDRQP